MPIEMIPKSSTDTDPSFVNFKGIVAQTVTFIHPSGVEEEEIIDTENFSMIMIAKCDEGNPSVSISVVSTVGDCTYDIVIPCNKDDLCPDDTAGRRMHEESFTRESFGEDGNDEEDVPYCLAEDFPCEGEEENMVYVCHYIPRQGYQTFCVPEADTVILGFYPHDYCGPCEGGYGSVGK